jgi:hypothetical protein
VRAKASKPSPRTVHLQPFLSVSLDLRPRCGLSQGLWNKVDSWRALRRVIATRAAGQPCRRSCVARNSEAEIPSFEFVPLNTARAMRLWRFATAGRSSRPPLYLVVICSGAVRQPLTKWAWMTYGWMTAALSMSCVAARAVRLLAPPNIVWCLYYCL